MIIVPLLLLLLTTLASASPYRPDLVQYNLNLNQNAQDPTQYFTNRSNTTYTPSPDNWRAVPFYTVLLDKFADGDPSNNQFFGSMYEWDWRETQLRFGGDIKGLASKLDYIQGMGIKGLYLSGTIFINMIWQADSPSSSPCPYLALTSLFRLFPLGFQCTRPSLGHHRRLARVHRRRTRQGNVYHARLHRRHPLRPHRFSRVCPVLSTPPHSLTAFPSPDS